MAYMELHLLAGGGGGTVYHCRACDKPTGAYIALDGRVRLIAALRQPVVMKVALESDDDTRAEARTLKLLAHPHVTAVLGVFSGPMMTAEGEVDVVGMLMPLADEPLSAVWSRGTDPRRLLVHLASGLAHIHSLQYIHGDLHIGNVLRFKDQWKLCDIGGFVVGVATRCMQLGTPYWSRSPEVAEHLAEVERIVGGSDAGRKPRLRARQAAAAAVRESARTRVALRHAIRIPAAPEMDVWALGSLVYTVATRLHWLGPPPSVDSYGWSTHPIEPELEAHDAARRSTKQRLRAVSSLGELGPLIVSCLHPSGRPTAGTVERLARV